MPKKEISLGRSLIKAHKNNKKFTKNDGFRHTSELPDGRDYGRLNLMSVTEQSSLAAFLDTAALAENDFMTEMSNVKIVDMNASTEDEDPLDHEEDQEMLCIPRRPHWDLDKMSKEEIDKNEKETFLKWRRKIAFHQEEQGINFTPFEKNLEVWRQLWRVIERSDVIVQILDARNPLLFRCLDLEAYVKEVDPSKMNVLLLNKADLLLESQRKSWCEYFERNGIQIVFFSALLEGQRSPEDVNDVCDSNVLATEIKNNPDVLSREELLRFFRNISANYKKEQHTPTVGLVGYPNVGKSSTLNALLMTKRVSVSATPGKTKHFQTFLLDDDNLCLCDCPGLVFPNFMSTKAQMVLNGVLPIDQLTEWNQPVSLVVKLIPRDVLESTYSLFIQTPGEGRDRNSLPTAEEFLNAHGYNRGYMTQGGRPDNSRSARYILKDFVNGKLLYCHAPPGIRQEDYQQFTVTKVKKNERKEGSDGKETNTQAPQILTAADKKFFLKAHVKGAISTKPEPFDPNAPGKPWKKHNNRNKKEKLRRIYKGNPYE